MTADIMTEWVPICECEGAQPVEIETEDDLTLPLASVVAHFPGTTTLKYRAPGGSTYRGVKLTEDILHPPSGGWSTANMYIAVNPTAAENQRKRAAEEGIQLYQPNKIVRSGLDDDTEVRDMILLGMKPTTTEAQVREYFADKATVLLCQLKKSKDLMTSYAFVKFSDKETERTLRRQKHMIDGRECTLKIPDSRASQGERGDRKVYVSYHDESLTKDEMRQHFEQFGEVEDVFVPTPWRHFAFVTFSSSHVAQSLVGKEHNVRGVSLLMKKGQAPKGKGGPEPGDNGDIGAHSQDGWGGWGRPGGPGPHNPGGIDHWQMYAKMMQESMYGAGRPGAETGGWGPGPVPPRGGPGGPPLPTGPSPSRGRGGPPSGYSWPGQSEYGYGGDRGGYGGPTGVNKY